MGCRKEIRNDLLLDEHAPGEWTYQKTGKNSAVVSGELVSRSRDFKEIPCPDLCFHLIRVTGFPQEPFFCSRLFTELSRILRPQGNLCFNLTPPPGTAALKLSANGQPDGAKTEETVIYYGMKNGFTLTAKELPSGKPRKITKNQGYSLHIILADPTVPQPSPRAETMTEKSGETLLWFIKEEDPHKPGEDPSPES